MTGAYYRPTYVNGPLPRLRPLPDHIRGMVHKRRQARERRQAQYEVLTQWREDIFAECAFEEALIQNVARQEGHSQSQRIEPVFAQQKPAWSTSFHTHLPRIVSLS